MTWHAVPADLLIFAVTVLGFVTIGLALIVRRVFVPRRVVFEAVAEADLTPAQRSYFDALDAELAALGYRPGGTRRATNMQGPAMLRLYLNPTDPAIVTANLMTSQAATGNQQAANYLEIVTQHRDGAILSTRNADVSDVLERLPDHVVVERRGLTDVARLKQVHDATAAEMLAHEPIHRRAEEFEAAFNEHHERWCSHLLERGQLRPDADDPELLRPSVATGLRGIANFLNPLADNFTPARFALGAVAGLALPVAGLLWLEGPGAALLGSQAAAGGLGSDVAAIVVLAALLAVSGATVGFVFEAKSFIWSFLFSYVLLRLASPAGFWLTLALAAWSGAVADLVCRRRMAARRLA